MNILQPSRGAPAYGDSDWIHAVPASHCQCGMKEAQPPSCTSSILIPPSSSHGCCCVLWWCWRGLCQTAVWWVFDPFFYGSAEERWSLKLPSRRGWAGGGVLALFNASSSSSELLSLCLAPSAVDFGCVLLCVNEHMLENMPQVYVFLWKWNPASWQIWRLMKQRSHYLIAFHYSKCYCNAEIIRNDPVSLSCEWQTPLTVC